MKLIGWARWSSSVLIVASIVLSNCNSSPPATPARPIDGMCVLHADVYAVNSISLNNKVFTAVRDSTSSSTGFSDFRRVNGPFGDSTLSLTNLDRLPSVYAISETWFRGLAFNESVRAQVIPALRTDGNGQPLVGESGLGGGARWNIFAQDFTGAWKVVRQAARNSAYALDQIADNNADTIAQLPQWMHIGTATPQLFFCAGTLTGDGKEKTTTLFEYLPAGTTAGATPTIVEIQDVLYGDERFRPDPPPDPPLGGNRIAPPAPTISGVTPRVIANQIVQCAMTQDGDDVTTRTLHLVVARGTQLLHATLSNFGTVTQPLTKGLTKTFSRFRTVSTWEDITQLFPATNFGNLDHVAVVATGHDLMLQIFFVGQGNDQHYRLWHTKQFGGGSFSPPIDVLSASGDSANGTVYDMPIRASFCPERGNRSPTLAQVNEEIVLTWYEPLTKSIAVREVVRSPRTWVTGRAASVYSQMMLAQRDGLAIRDSNGNVLGTNVLRTRISLRPYSDTPP